MTHHLVVLTNDYLNRILRGHKTVECRLSRTKRAPFGLVATGDVLWLKQSGGPIKARTTARRVEFVHPVDEAKLHHIRRRHGNALQANSAFFDNRTQIRFATLIQLGRVRRVTPFSIKKTDRHAWVVLSAPPVPCV